MTEVCKENSFKQYATLIFLIQIIPKIYPFYIGEKGKFHI